MRSALSCPDCGEPMRYGFRKACRSCGAGLVMIPWPLYPRGVRVYVKGPRPVTAYVALLIILSVAAIKVLTLLASGQPFKLRFTLIFLPLFGAIGFFARISAGDAVPFH